MINDTLEIVITGSLSHINSWIDITVNFP